MRRYRLRVVDRWIIISWIRIRMIKLCLHLPRRTWVYRDWIELVSLSCAHVRANWFNRRVDVFLEWLITINLILRCWVHESWMDLLLSPKCLSWNLFLHSWWTVRNILVLLYRICFIDVSCSWPWSYSSVKSASWVWASSSPSTRPGPRACSRTSSWVWSISLPWSFRDFAMQCWHWFKLILFLLSLSIIFSHHSSSRILLSLELTSLLVIGPIRKLLVVLSFLLIGIHSIFVEVSELDVQLLNLLWRHAVWLPINKTFDGW